MVRFFALPRKPSVRASKSTLPRLGSGASCCLQRERITNIILAVQRPEGAADEIGIIAGREHMIELLIFLAHVVEGKKRPCPEKL